MMKNTSPVGIKKEKPVVMMDFPSAMKEVIQGRKVRRIEWESEEVFVFLHDKYLSIQYPGKSPSPLLVSDGDLMGEDWIVLE
jgi:hypothetical protein